MEGTGQHCDWEGRQDTRGPLVAISRVVLGFLKRKQSFVQWQNTRRLERRKSALYEPYGVYHQLRRTTLI